MDQTVACIVLLLCWFLGIAVGLAYAKYKQKEQPVGTLRIYTGDPDGVYMTLESYVIPEYIMTQKEVTLSVDVTDVSQK